MLSTGIIFLHVHSQVVYNNCVKFHQYPLICLGGDALTKNMDELNPIYTQKALLVGGIIIHCTQLTHTHLRADISVSLPYIS